MNHENVEQSWKERIAQVHWQHTQEKVALLTALKARFGPQVGEVVAQVASERAYQEWQAIARQNSRTSIEDLITLLWEPLRAKGFVFTVDRCADGVQVQCTQCPLAQLAQQTDGKEWLFHLYCAVDPAVAQGFNPRIGLRRTKTLMEGHHCCDHFYFMK